MSGVRAVVTDFGGVLTTPLFNAFARVQEEQGIGVEALGMAMFTLTQTRGENPLYALERGEMPEPEFLRIVGEAVGEQVGRPVSMERFAETYFEQLDPNEELIAHLRALKTERGLRLAMLTNNVREWEARWRAMLPVDELFEVVVDSAFVGMRKPDPAIYELTLARLDLPAEECVFLDDLEVNCEAARALGMRAIRFESTPQAIADLDAALAA
jgi:putative hydrolase of the HAD superfamily